MNIIIKVIYKRSVCNMRSYGSSAEEEIMRSLLGGSSSSSSGDFSSAISILALILAIAATVLAFVFILSKKGRSSQKPFVKFLVNVCDFRSLIIEKISKPSTSSLPPLPFSTASWEYSISVPICMAQPFSKACSQ